MLLKTNEMFKLRQAQNNGAKALYQGYLSAIDGTDDLVNENSIEYLKCFVNYPGNICEGIIRQLKNSSLTTETWGEEYLRLLTIIAAYHLDRNEVHTGLLWAKKAVDLFGYFLPTLRRDLKEEIIYNMSATSMICCFPNQFNESVYDQFYLDWEVKRYYIFGNEKYQNNN